MDSEINDTSYINISYGEGNVNIGIQKENLWLNELYPHMKTDNEVKNQFFKARIEI